LKLAKTHKLTAIKAKARREGWLANIRSEADEVAALNGCYFSRRHADYVTEFFPAFLCHSKGNQWAGKPFELLDYQRTDIIEPLFGWLKPNNMRRFTTAYIEMGKKQGKSTLASGLGIYMLVGDREPGAEVYSTAADKEQAAIVHTEAINMIDASPALTRALKINRSTNNIYFPATKSYYRALASMPRGKSGFNGHCCICDELHLWQGRKLWDVIRYMGWARAQSLLFIITNAGDDLLSVCYEQHEYGQKVLDGTFHDDNFFAYIAGVTKDELDIPNSDREAKTGIYDRKLWKKALPSIGITVEEELFEKEIAAAMETPSSLANFLRYSFSIWATAENPWLDMGVWIACRLEYSETDLLDKTCGGGLDVAKILDMTALVLCFPDEDREDLFRMLAWFWMPEETAIERTRKGLAPYLQWRDDGWLTLTDGSVTDYSFVEKQIVEASNKFRIFELAFDESQAEYLTQRVEEQGIARHEFTQGMSRFAHPTSEFERLLIMGKESKQKTGLLHNGHKILDWQAGHTKVKTDADGRIRPVKQKHGDYRTIDGIVAGIMALDRAMHAPKAPKGNLFLT
jgi:phage terminase large subunit-like protein